MSVRILSGSSGVEHFSSDLFSACVCSSKTSLKTNFSVFVNEYEVFVGECITNLSPGTKPHNLFKILGVGLSNPAAIGGSVLSSGIASALLDSFTALILSKAGEVDEKYVFVED